MNMTNVRLYVDLLGCYVILCVHKCSLYLCVCEFLDYLDHLPPGAPDMQNAESEFKYGGTYGGIIQKMCP